MKILFVCTGNTCRSVLAHYYGALLADQKKMPLEFFSVGLSAHKSIVQPPIVAQLLEKEGVRGFSHIPVRLTSELAEGADLILCMTAVHRDRVKESYPSAAEKTFTMMDYAGLGDYDIPDPYGRGDRFYVKIFALIKSAVQALLEKLEKKV